MSSKVQENPAESKDFKTIQGEINKLTKLLNSYDQATPQNLKEIKIRLESISSKVFINSERYDYKKTMDEEVFAYSNPFSIYTALKEVTNLAIMSDLPENIKPHFFSIELLREYFLKKYVADLENTKEKYFELARQSEKTS